jgi:hypothetical protein
MSEIDPHVPGAKLDTGKNRLGLVLGDFAPALWQVGLVGTHGAAKYTDGGWKHVPNGVERYTSALYRHLLKEKTEGPVDPEFGLHHAAHAAWNALARLTLLLENNNGTARDQVPTVSGTTPSQDPAPRENGEPVPGRDSRLMVLGDTSGFVGRMEIHTPAQEGVHNRTPPTKSQAKRLAVQTTSGGKTSSGGFGV